MGVFAASGQARTFDFMAGDVGFVPFAMGHYVENTGTTPLRFLEVFKSSYYADVSLNQWLALTPPELVKAHLNLDPQALAGLAQGEVSGRARMTSPARETRGSSILIRTVAPWRLALAQIVVRGADGLACRAVGIEALLGDSGNAAIVTHLDDVEPSATIPYTSSACLRASPPRARSCS